MKTFCNSFQSCVINNGVSSNFFTLERGVRQGDPLSPYLFIIAVETLAIAVRQKESIKGITIGSPHVRESMTVLDSGFHPVDSGFRLLDSGFQLSGFWIPKRAGFQIFFCFNAFLRTSFSCSNLAILKDVV